MADPQVLLSLREVRKVYRMGDVQVQALRNATLDVHSGEFLVVVGPSGSGKSTLLNILGGIDRPTSGTVTFRGDDLTRATERELTLYRRRHVGFVFQLFNLIPSLTALENVQVAREIAPRPQDPLAMLGLVGLGARADHFPAQLSGGEQQRVAIARALVSDPELLLCDEPTGAVDTEMTVQVLELLCNLNRELGKTLVLITHERNVAALGHRVARIVDGQIASVTVNERPARPADLEW
jgi:putative ABC transport system ATP-binding protein